MTDVCGGETGGERRDNDKRRYAEEMADSRGDRGREAEAAGIPEPEGAAGVFWGTAPV